jgi:hypothetical protein
MDDGLEAVVPPEAIREEGLYDIRVISPGASNGVSHPAHLIVRFQN